MEIKNFKVYFDNEPMEQSIGLYLAFFVIGLFFSLLALLPFWAVVAWSAVVIPVCALFGVIYANAPKAGLATGVVFLIPTFCVGLIRIILWLF